METVKVIQGLLTALDKYVPENIDEATTEAVKNARAFITLAGGQGQVQEAARKGFES